VSAHAAPGQGEFWATAPLGRYEPAQLWYDTTDKRLVVLVAGKEVPVVEPVLPGLEVVPDVRHIQWNSPVDAWAELHIRDCRECQERFLGNPFVGISQAGRAAWSTKKP
jgi:hypothetical protein